MLRDYLNVTKPGIVMANVIAAATGFVLAAGGLVVFPTESVYGLGADALSPDAVERLVESAYREAIVETSTVPLARASIEVVQAEEGKPLIFKATVPVRPDVTLGDYKHFNFGPEIDVIDDARVDQVVEALAGDRVLPNRGEVLAHAAQSVRPDRLDTRLLQRIDHALADASGGHVDDPPQADIVVRVEEELQVRQGVLDFLALVEADAADDAVGEVLAAQRVLEDARLGVGAVEDRHRRVTAGAQRGARDAGRRARRTKERDAGADAPAWVCRRVAQLEEHRSPKPGVGGSIPSSPASHRGVGSRG